MRKGPIARLSDIRLRLAINNEQIVVTISRVTPSVVTLFRYEEEL